MLIKKRLIKISWQFIIIIQTFFTLSPDLNMIFNLLSCVDQFEFEWVSIFGSIMDNLCQTLLQICLLPWSHILQLHPKDLKKMKLFRLWPSAFLTGILFWILENFSNEFHNHLQNSNYKCEKHFIKQFLKTSVFRQKFL